MLSPDPFQSRNRRWIPSFWPFITGGSTSEHDCTMPAISHKPMGQTPIMIGPYFERTKTGPQRMRWNPLRPAAQGVVLVLFLCVVLRVTVTNLIFPPPGRCDAGVQQPTLYGLPAGGKA
jgi:hypothetical protein